MKTKYLIFIIAILIISGTCVIAWSKLAAEASVETKAKTDSLKTPKLDTQILAKFAKACQQFDPNQKEFLLIGILNVVDGADSSQKINNATYVLSKEGEDFYFKLGETETINANGLYLFLDHEQKKIMLANQKPLLAGIGMPDANKLLKNLNGEMYELTDQQVGDAEKISLINEYHMSCKEFTLLLNKENQQLQTILIRLSHNEYPEDKKKDKKIELKIAQLGNNSNLRNYVDKKVVKKEGEEWVLAAAYQDYELIIL